MYSEERERTSERDIAVKITSMLARESRKMKY